MLGTVLSTPPEDAADGEEEEEHGGGQGAEDKAEVALSGRGERGAEERGELRVVG